MTLYTVSVSDPKEEPPLDLPAPPPGAQPGAHPSAKRKYVLDDFDPAVVGYRSTEERKAGAAKPKRKWGKAAGTAGLAAVLLAVVVSTITILALPGCLKRKCIEAAAARGVVLTIDDVHLGAGRFTLVNATASAPELPGVSAKATEIEIEMAGLTPMRVTARSPELVIDGPYEQVKESFAKWRATHKGSIPGDGAGAGGATPRLVLEGAHVAWTRPFGANVKLDVLEMRAEIGRTGTNDEVHVLSPHVIVNVGGSNVGPWRITYDREGADARSRIGFDPQLADGPNAIFVTSGERIATVDVSIPRTQLVNVGIAPELFGLPAGSSTQIEANIRFTHSVANRVDAKATLGLFAIKTAALPVALDAKAELQVAGDPSSAEVKKGTLSVGPLNGAVLGTLRVFDDGIRIDLGWKAGPLPCDAFASAPSIPTVTGAAPLGDLANQLKQFAQATGIAKVTGEVRMEGSLIFDSRDFGTAMVRFTPANTCDLALFGGK